MKVPTPTKVERPVTESPVPTFNCPPSYVKLASSSRVFPEPTMTTLFSVRVSTFTVSLNVENQDTSKVVVVAPSPRTLIPAEKVEKPTNVEIPETLS